jgi:hypothetical protein
MKDDVEYEALHNSDTHSNTELDSDSQPQHYRQRRRQNLVSKLKQHSWIANIALLLIIIALLIEKRWSKSSYGGKKQKGHRYEFTGDITGFAPTFSQQITTFTPNDTFAPENPSEFWSNKTQDAWLSIVPSTCHLLSLLHFHTTCIFRYVP